MTNPLNDKYTLPFEGNYHDGTIIILPYRTDTWEDGGKKAFEEFKEIIFAISLYEHVYVIKSKNIKYDYSELVNKKNISIHEIEYDDSWARDNTLIFLRNKDGRLRAVDFGFNAWGGLVDGLYSPWDNDNNLGKKLFALSSLNLYIEIIKGSYKLEVGILKENVSVFPLCKILEFIF